MSNDPDQIREQIERTRADLSSNVNTLADTVNPAHAAKRQVGKVKGAVFGVKDTVMGSASDAGDKLSSAHSSVSDAVSEAPDQLRSRTAGNPLAAGLIAFGIGWLAGSLLPASAPEQQAANKVKDVAAPVLRRRRDRPSEAPQGTGPAGGGVSEGHRGRGRGNDQGRRRGPPLTTSNIRHKTPPTPCNTRAAVANAIPVRWQATPTRDRPKFTHNPIADRRRYIGARGR